jgi:RNA polymerase primary sigma factor
MSDANKSLHCRAGGGFSPKADAMAESPNGIPLIAEDPFASWPRDVVSQEEVNDEESHDEWGPLSDNMAEINAQDDGPDSIMGLYIKDSSRFSLLSPEEERNLAKEMEVGREAERQLKSGQITQKEECERLNELVRRGKAARERLILSSTRLVVSIARDYIGYGIPLPDLVQEGNIGLIRAVDLFSLEEGCRLSTYATWWIRRSITRYIENTARGIRLSVRSEEKLRRIWRESQRMRQETGQEPNIDEVAKRVGIQPKEARQLALLSRQLLSLDELVGGEEKDSPLSDFVVDESMSVQDVAYISALRERIRAIIDKLPPREANIISLHYGLGDGRAYTLEEIGKKLGITRERVRQLEARAMTRLRHPTRLRQLREFM